jgi:tRNA nucleotidyltransferase (CCA-adding enzyme)
MTPTEYLEAVLREQTLVPGGPELKELQKQHDNVERILEKKFEDSPPTIYKGGSRAKQTMIREAYDLDLPTYFGQDDTSAGETLEEIFNNVAVALEDDYYVERRRSALRLKSKDSIDDTHIDVVPGRFFDDDSGAAWIYQHQAEKCRLKTNLHTHIVHIRDSGFRQVIRLAKLWNLRENVGMKTFVLELLAVKLLDEEKDMSLPAQFQYLLEQFRDNADNLTVVDPANENNDLTPALDAVRSKLSYAADATLQRLEQDGWGAVFGEVENEEERKQAAARVKAAVPAEQQYQPWSREQ